MEDLAPIVLCAYNRVAHLRKTLEALRQNPEAAASDLFVFSDGPRSAGAAPAVEEVRACLRTLDGFRKVAVVERQTNYGLSRSVVGAVSDIVARYGRAIVLEDDLVTSPYFLKYMNDGLRLYERDDTVASIHGYLLPLPVKVPETFFLRGADCWGWATWQRAWRCYDPDAAGHLRTLKATQSEKDFGMYYVRMLEDRIAGWNDSWAILWHASTYNRHQYTLYPGRSLVVNVGLDRSGVHAGRTDSYRSELSAQPINVTRIPIEENRLAHLEALRIMESEDRPLKRFVMRMARRLLRRRAPGSR